MIENQRDQELRMSVLRVRKDGTIGEPRDYGSVPAKSTKKLDSIVFIPESVFRIEAVDPSGNVVFSHDYNLDDLDKINWKITIPP